VFFDEFGFSFLEPLATTWARKGKRPILRRVARDRRVLSTAVALTMSGKIYKRHFEGSIKSDQVIATPQHIQQHLPGKIILIWDRARTHKSKKTQAFLAVHPEIWVEELPACAPELNPEEFCHGNVKHPHKQNPDASDAQSRFCSSTAPARFASQFLPRRRSYCSATSTNVNKSDREPPGG
jgi:transposase